MQIGTRLLHDQRRRQMKAHSDFCVLQTGDSTHIFEKVFACKPMKRMNEEISIAFQTTHHGRNLHSM